MSVISVLWSPLLLYLSLISTCFGNDWIGCDYVFRNEDFYYGTYRIRRSGRYCLGEDIILNPLPGDSSSPNKYGAWFPTDDQFYPGSRSHDDGGWALGFFAGISIEVSNVELDLNGFEISMAKPFYLQQRFLNLIQIQNAPFNEDQGPANFGQTIDKIKHVTIKNGRLGLSSHNGIHAFDVENVLVSNLKIFNFEVAGIQFNGFYDVDIRNVDIGPCSTDVPFWGYYSHARFSLNGFELIDKKDKKYIRFQGGREMTVQKIYENLRDSLDIAYRFEMGQTTQNDIDHPLYKLSIEMYKNPFRWPDGGAIYGMIFNSKGFAIQGFGDADNEERDEGNKLYLENIKIDGLFLNVNEFPTLYFDRCEGYYYNEDGTTSLTPVMGRFGDVFDVRRSLPFEAWNYIDRGFGDHNFGFNYGDIKYVGNPLSDAQVALGIFSDPFESNWGLRSETDSRRGKETFYRWATESGDKYDNGLPSCARFACNADCMFHLNKGIIGIRMDGIENAVLKNVDIKNLYNESPLGSAACGSYYGPFDGGQPSGIQREGYAGGDIKGISAINCGTTEIYGSCNMENLKSSYGDVIGLHMMDNSQIYLDEGSNGMKFTNFEGGASVSGGLYDQLLRDGYSPYPNNFYDCNIKAEQLRERSQNAYPYDYSGGNDQFNGNGYIYPNGAIQAECRELYFDNNGERRRRLVQL